MLGQLLNWFLINKDQTSGQFVCPRYGPTFTASISFAHPLKLVDELHILSSGKFSFTFSIVVYDSLSKVPYVSRNYLDIFMDILFISNMDHEKLGLENCAFSQM